MSVPAVIIETHVYTEETTKGREAGRLIIEVMVEFLSTVWSHLYVWVEKLKICDSPLSME